MDEDIKKLIFKAHNEDEDIRQEAIVELRNYTSIPEVSSFLRSLIYDKNGHVRILAAEALARARLYPEDAIPVLVTVLEVVDDAHIANLEHAKNWRRVAAGALGFYGTKATSAIAALKNALLDPDTNVRGYAAMSLGEIGNAAMVALQDLRVLRQNETDEKLRSIYDKIIKKIVGSENFIIITKDEIETHLKDNRQNRFGRCNEGL